MLSKVAWLLIAALPSADPELLLDLDTQPSKTTRSQLVEATAEGVLYTQFEPDGGTALWWSRWDGAPERVRSVGSARVIAGRLGADFILFSGMQGQVLVEKLSLTPGPLLEPLMTVPDVTALPSTDSTTAFWWGSSTGTFTTDGNVSGTWKATGRTLPLACSGPASSSRVSEHGRAGKTAGFASSVFPSTCWKGLVTTSCSIGPSFKMSSESRSPTRANVGCTLEASSPG